MRWYAEKIFDDMAAAIRDLASDVPQCDRRDPSWLRTLQAEPRTHTPTPTPTHTHPHPHPRTPTHIQQTLCQETWHLNVHGHMNVMNTRSTAHQRTGTGTNSSTCTRVFLVVGHSKVQVQSAEGYESAQIFHNFHRSFFSSSALCSTVMYWFKVAMERPAHAPAGLGF